MPADRKAIVLVVDDHKGVARTLAWVLEASGYITAVAHSGSNAVEMATKVGPKVALVDVGRPDVDGIKTAVEICNILPHCHIVLISGDPDSASLIAQQNRFEVMAKPIELRALLTKVAGLLSRDGRNRQGHTRD